MHIALDLINMTVSSCEVSMSEVVAAFVVGVKKP